MACLVMGVLNITPDSFSDGGRYFDHRRALEHGFEMIEHGADIIDVGGESSRPGASPVPATEELRRVLPVVAALAEHVRVSIDTMKVEVARAAIDAGASLLNDVSASFTELAAASGVGLVLMHMRGRPATMQHDPHYDDVVGEVASFLDDKSRAARAAGVKECYVDPGIGFGKTLAHNLALLAALPSLVAAGVPVLIGTSRKSFLGEIAVPPGERALVVDDRFEASLATATYAMAVGAAIVRVHDVKATKDAARIVGDVAVDEQVVMRR